jgi:SAM-dependent methyltransferase
MGADERLGSSDEIRERVREGYARVVENASRCCGSAPPGSEAVALRVGYSEGQLDEVPEGANLGLGCGNPTGLAEIRSGEVVLDLGSGAGFDAFLAARAVGPDGRVIGVDMTEAMLDKARDNAARGGFTNVEFRSGTIERLPVEDGSVDVIVSNCVINLSPEKARVFREAFRVLRPGGRISISDLVLDRPLPPEIVGNLAAYLGCVGGASLRDDYLEAVRKAGFRDVRVLRETRWRELVAGDEDELARLATAYGIPPELARRAVDAVTSIHLRAVK